MGQLSVYANGAKLNLGPKKQRALLALLLVNANRMVPLDLILEEMWGSAGSNKINALRVYVSRLRATLEPNRARGELSVLETHECGYLLRVDLSGFDIARFEQLVGDATDARPSSLPEAARLYGAALGLWNGPPYQEFGYENFTQMERHRLQQLHLSACLDRLEVELAQGRASELVSELEGLQIQYPLRERVVMLLALALYRSGREAESIQAIDRFRYRLLVELGADPAPNVLKFERQLLRHDPAIAATVISTAVGSATEASY